VGIDRLFQGRLDELIRLLGLDDIVAQQGDERDQEQVDAAGNLNAPPVGGTVDVGNILFRNN
jgi:hypothetical protein